MPLAPDSIQALDDALNRLATESILATPGRDEGLIPSYSLLGEMREHASAEAVLVAAITAVHSVLDAKLDAAQPFDAASLGELRRLIEWMPIALDALRSDKPLPTFSAGVVDSTAALPTESEGGKHSHTDTLMDLNFQENQELLTEFYAEAVDHLQQIEAALLVLDQKPEDPEALNSIFRSFHTIKGNAGFLGLVPMHTLAHEVESLLDLARNHQLRLTPPIITEILRSRDALQALTQQIGVALEKGHLPSEIVPVSHLIRAVNLLSCPSDTQATANVSTAAKPTVSPSVTQSQVVEEKPSAASVAPDPVEAPAAAAPTSAQTTAGGQTVRVNTEKLDSLMDVVGELVIVQSQLIESARSISDANSPIQRNVTQLSRITKDLQHTAMSLRMIPIKPTFQKMERLSRDLARNFGKKVQFQVSGEDTELDRTVVEEISDPLVHMVRNSLDHGLELPEQRVAAGKAEMGHVHLRAYHLGSNIVIELQDDGRGIDPEKILKKAVEKGIVAPNAQLDREQIFALIFAPGFSTAEKITSVSGRGVGMDVVKRNIEKLRGKIEIVSEVGKGSTFKIKLPLTMAIIDGLVVRVGTDKFILPSTSVQMAMRPSQESITTVHGTGEVIELRGRILPLHRLHRRFGINADSEVPWEGIVVIVEHSGRVSALLVDEMVNKQEVVIKNLGSFMSSLPGVAGGAILGDGNIALILDPVTLLQAA